ncbi:hypothetical protein ASC77_21115 [Nocardioides sp. Root1257]|uniref:type IV toxin-antitoxin system AbiEi family antitoxin domain-containing protein n=1 Tax=unclassified Nocardioides TaxID=2615069 RepID=UPI0007020784|nr:MULTISPECIES: type IV toxin-antitoxin system AbiEi family antitoxin domain-containing protein [unclassified Nocardioides]KQW43902.1 hypothetical protein ASC77_21115 [Nocardioides sp. Root1257]KRC42343.1 hypothetical protein ASE24_20910 [Nocardioides sp. Root224]
MDDIERLLRDQDGVLSRTQALEAGMSRTAVARALRRREWVAVHPGVYVDHTGPLTWHQRAWAAVLLCWPAALDGPSARRAYDGPGRRGDVDGPVHVAIDRDRHLRRPPGVRLRRVSGLDEKVQWNLGPPRLRYDELVIDLAVAASDQLAAVAVLADACGARRTTAARLLDVLHQRRRVAGRRFLVGVLEDVAAGACSVLEHGYLDRVERPHRLPVGSRQSERFAHGGRIFQDVEYRALGLTVELDGRLHHSSVVERDRDLERDLDQAVADDGRTLRLGYGQVFRHGCRTTSQVARLMQRLGWPGEMARCPNCGGPDQPG